MQKEKKIEEVKQEIISTITAAKLLGYKVVQKREKIYDGVKIQTMFLNGKSSNFFDIYVGNDKKFKNIVYYTINGIGRSENIIEKLREIQKVL